MKTKVGNKLPTLYSKCRGFYPLINICMSNHRGEILHNKVNAIRMYSRNNICIIPTYRCNADCSFCYAKGLYKRFPQDMEWDVFRKVVDYCVQNGKDEISFLGGEPTLWPYINKAVAYLRERRIQVSFFTNGISYSNPPPDCVLINIHNDFNNTAKGMITKTIGFYKSSGTEVTLRYNLVSSSSIDEDDRFLMFSVPLVTRVSITPAIPYIPSRELGNRIFRLVKKFHKKGIAVKISRAIPVCLFDVKQYKYLREQCLMRKKCYSEKNVVINPDGETLFPCVNISNYEKKLFEESLEEINNAYKIFFQRLSSVFPFAECKECKYALNNNCQAGCLAMRSGEVMEDVVNLVERCE